jgi:dienelactone hydrolase
MQLIKNIEIKGKHNRPILTDLFYLENGSPKDVVIFCHGYKGYKDWGAWNLVAETFAKKNIFFIKMNFSHNGGTAEQPIDFPDLEAFGQNNFMKELDDLDSLLSWVHSANAYKNELNTSKITVIGHSRGGGIVVLKAASDNRITKVISWAGVSDFGSRFPKGEALDVWEKNGVAYITNARTNQQMPHYFQFYSTFIENEQILTISTAVKKLNIPYLIVHGSMDETVPLAEAKKLNTWYNKSQLEVIEGANHTFGSSQPWNERSLPPHLQIVCEQSLKFTKL